MPSSDIRHKNQNRQILAQLGVVLWANRDSKVISITKRGMPAAISAIAPPDQLSAQDLHSPIASRTLNLPSSEKVSKAANISEKTAKISTPKNPKQIIDALKATLQVKAHEPTADDTDAPERQVSAHASNTFQIEFHLQAIIYRDWLILIDADGLDSADRELWLSLTKAIKNEAKRTQAAFFTDALNYPLFPDDPDANCLSVASTSVMGFVFGCMRRAPDLSHIAILNKLPDYLNLSEMHQITVHKNHQISQMLIDREQKKQFWQMLHAQ